MGRMTNNVLIDDTNRFGIVSCYHKTFEIITTPILPRKNIAWCC